jgi:hypothetical protein
MPFTEKTLGQAQIATGSATTLYTAPASTRAIVKDIQVCNVTAAAVTITIWVDPDGTGATDAEAILESYSIPAQDFLHWSGYLVLQAAATIKAQAGTGSAITITVSGAELT